MAKTNELQKTIVMKREEMGETWQRNWYLVDAKGHTLGRLAVQIARVLMGKHKPIYTPHVDVGDYVVVINAADVKVTGKKREQKMYYHYSGYPGGLRERTFEQMITKHPTRPIYDAVRRMLPKSTLGRRMLRKLKVYPGPDHPHEAQHPQPIEITWG
jgi:large subunit ribosomal protein L13